MGLGSSREGHIDTQPRVIEGLNCINRPLIMSLILCRSCSSVLPFQARLNVECTRTKSLEDVRQPYVHQLGMALEKACVHCSQIHQVSQPPFQEDSAFC